MVCIMSGGLNLVKKILAYFVCLHLELDYSIVLLPTLNTCRPHLF
jgi:hypothetical protein